MSAPRKRSGTLTKERSSRMKSKLFLLFLGIMIMIVVGLLVAGCGLISNTGAYNDYYYPDWTSDGKIICIKKVSAWEETGSWPGGGTSRRITSEKYYIVTMDENGNNEKIIKQINGIGKVAASPLGNYIAYSDNNLLRITSNLGVDISSINCGQNFQINTFDWSPDETKLIFDAGLSPNYEQAIINRDGSNKQIISNNGSSVAWRYGDKIIMDKPIPGEVFRVVTLNGTYLTEINYYPKIQGGEYNIIKANTSEVIYSSAYEQGIKRFYLISPEADPIIIINRNDIWNIHISPDGTKIIGNGTGSGTDFGSEVLKINIDGTGFIKIK